ncbi:hypothetical protein ACIBP4_04505 [Micromonospora maritima]|uniref:Restriction endonuclease n=1 Tax=Micromonospora maritima TaxID=986711 RepID=A0ABW7ZID7_9ACTN
MTTVNWEREPGERVEEFVAALLLLEHPHGNLITPSRGDRGVDIRVEHPEGFDIYQVKRYASRLDARQAAEIGKSWSTFVRETLPRLPVRSWTLVTPWNPTNERLDWLAELTAEAPFPCRWMGGTNLDVLAARHPELVDYYFGDGGERLHRLMADALQGGRDLPRGVPPQDMLAAAVERQRAIVTNLDQVDPFYRYELEIRTGVVGDLPWDTELGRWASAAYVQYQQLPDGQYSVLRLLPKSAESARLRPITISGRLEVTSGSPEHQAVENFVQFGTPFVDVPGTVTEVIGPPGVARSTPGQGRFQFMVAPESAADLPDLEIRLLDTTGTTHHTLNLTDVELSNGLNGTGSWLSGYDQGGAVQFQFFVNGKDGDAVQLNAQSLTGKVPADVLPAVRLTADLGPGMGIMAAVRGGGPAVTPVWEMSDEPVTPVARWHVRLLEALIAIQRHTYQRITVPDVDATSTADLDAILRVGRLLRGEHVEGTWSEIPLTVTSPENLPVGADEFTFAGLFPMTVRINGHDIALNMRRQIVYCAARLVEPAPAETDQAGGPLRLVPGSTDRAIITAVPDVTGPPRVGIGEA